MSAKMSREDFLVYDEVKDSIRAYLNITFLEEYGIIEEAIEITQQYEIIVVAKNYIKYLGILMKAYEEFEKIDVAFSSSSLQKLKQKIDEVENVYAIFTSNKFYFNKYFVSFSRENELLIYIKTNMPNYFDDVYSIMLREFKSMYNYEVNYILQTLKIILNTYIVYFEKLLWKEAISSPKISHTFFVKGFTKIDTKSYINYFFETTYPYSNEYKEMKRMVDEL